MRIRFSYRNYPLSPELTEKSRKTAMLTQPLMGIALGGLLGFGSAMLFPDSLELPLILMFGGIILGPILLSKYRKKKYAEYDAAYARILQSRGR